METLQWIVTAVLGVTFLGDIVLHFVLPSRKRKDYAETELAEHDADKAEVERLHMMIDHQQKSLDTYLKIEKDNAERIAEQNKSLNDKTEQIRKLTDQLIESEHGRNADKDEIARLTATLGEANTLIEYLLQWRCERTDCKDERGRKPPNKRLAGLKYEPPKRAVK